jgi:dTDP-4-dehydrorhamnose reductase
MKILILGGDGMLGHELLMLLRERHEVKVTLRQEFSAYSGSALFSSDNSFAGVDVRVSDRLLTVLSEFHPDAVLNAVGIVKQRPDGLDIIPNLEINALLPHRLARICGAVGARLIHISTDCVFSGNRGHYREDDRPDPVDIYGHSKLLGEVVQAGVITLRTSIIGRSLFRNASLIDWFLRQRGRINGYRNAIFSGFTTKELSRVIETLLERHAGAAGLYHLSSSPISKYDLLVRLRDRLGRAIDIVADDSVRIDRSLDSTRFRAEFAYTPPSWDDMLEELADDIREKKADGVPS